MTALDFVFNHESVYSSICDDFTEGGFSCADIISSESNIFYECKNGGQTFGALMFAKIRHTMAEAHCACLPHHRGKDFIDSTVMAINDIFNTTSIISIIAYCVEFNKASMFFARACGFSRVGVIPDCYIKDNKKNDMVLYQINKG